MTLQIIKPYSPLFLLLFTLLGCSKPKGPEVTQQNIREVLTKYGQENPENEVIIETKHGSMRIRLYDDTPLHRANFIKLIKEGYFEEPEFYRIVSEFMIQGGDLNKKLSWHIPAEFNPKYFHKKGALAMARESENNPEKQSSATEFFIVQGSRYYDEDLDMEERNLGRTLTPEQREVYRTIGGYMDLDQNYTVFGEVIEGMEVIDLIAHEKAYNEKPLRKIQLKIRLLESK